MTEKMIFMNENLSGNLPGDLLTLRRMCNGSSSSARLHFWIPRQFVLVYVLTVFFMQIVCNVLSFNLDTFASMTMPCD